MCSAARKKQPPVSRGRSHGVGKLANLHFIVDNLTASSNYSPLVAIRLWLLPPHRVTLIAKQGSWPVRRDFGSRLQPESKSWNLLEQRRHNSRLFSDSERNDLVLARSRLGQNCVEFENEHATQSFR